MAVFVNIKGKLINIEYIVTIIPDEKSDNNFWVSYRDMINISDNPEDIQKVYGLESIHVDDTNLSPIEYIKQNKIIIKE